MPLACCLTRNPDKLPFLVAYPQPSSVPLLLCHSSWELCSWLEFCPELIGFLLQSSSYGESVSTLGFGSRVSEITLGQAKKNSESAQIFEAKDQVVRYGDVHCMHHTLLSLHSQQANCMHKTQGHQEHTALLMCKFHLQYCLALAFCRF